MQSKGGSVRVKLRGINKVHKTLASGEKVEIHYAYRGKGAPAFWRSDSGVVRGSPAYVAAFGACAGPTEAKGKFRSLILSFLASQDFSTLAPRTQSDMRTSINHPKNGIDAEFGDSPVGVFNDSRIRGEVLGWRDRIGGKVGDDRMRHLQRIVGWAYDRSKLTFNHLTRLKGIYDSSRADIIWTPDEIAQFLDGCPDWCGRILTAATETGLRPGDLHDLDRTHIHKTPNGHRIVMFTNKGQRKRRIASIPVTAKMQALIDATPKRQGRILVNSDGNPFSHENQLGQAISKRRDKLGMRKDLRLYDARGTAATKLLQAGATMKEIAIIMGWSIKHASEVVERYAALTPEMSDGILAKLQDAKDSKQNETGADLQTKVQTAP
jgi:hypothetical protein